MLAVSMVDTFGGAYCLSLSLTRGTDMERFGAAVARWAHNPKVRGSKPRIAIRIFFAAAYQKFLADAA